MTVTADAVRVDPEQLRAEATDFELTWSGRNLPDPEGYLMRLELEPGIQVWYVWSYVDELETWTPMTVR